MVEAMPDQERPSAYVDTCIIIGADEKDLGQPEQDALQMLLNLGKSGDLTLCAGPLTQEERARRRGTNGGGAPTIYAQLADVPRVDEQWRMPAPLTNLLSGPKAGPIVRDEALGRLRTILSGKNDEDDARHVYQAAKNGIDYFVTCDKGIIRAANKIEAEVFLRVRAPSKLVAEIAPR
jgi:predicted nucleic acid-binding protein